MGSVIIINADGPERRVALIENGQLAELYVERSCDRRIVGNIYKGKITRILPGIQAAFVDIGIGRTAFLYGNDIRETKDPGLFFVEAEYPSDDRDVTEEMLPPGNVRVPILERVRDGQEILVQVAKEPIGVKGARVTSYISLPGRNLVYLPGLDHVGVSRRIVDEAERQRLKDIVNERRNVGEGFIVRTVAEGQSAEVLHADMSFLTTLGADLEEQQVGKNAPSLIFEELDLSLRAIRDLVNDDVEKIVVDHIGEFEKLKHYIEKYCPDKLATVELYRGVEPVFDIFGIEIEIDRILERKVWLKSGGYLVIDQNEALTSIDVNTGRYVGRRNVDDTIAKTNLEAVKEVVTQLRLRNIGGIIVVDFIDMERESDREKVSKTLAEYLKPDRAKCNIQPISEIGLVEMTRKRVRGSLLQQLTQSCPYCDGKGYVKSPLTVCHEVLREIRRQASTLPGYGVYVDVHPDVADLLEDSEHEHLEVLEKRYAKTVYVKPCAYFHLEQFEIHVRAQK